MIGPYDKITEETRRLMLGNKTDYIVNKIYKSEIGNIPFYINNKGYYHILKIEKKVLTHNLIGYDINDYMLTKHNTFKYIKNYGTYKALSDALNELLEIKIV